MNKYLNKLALILSLMLFAVANAETVNESPINDGAVEKMAPEEDNSPKFDFKFVNSDIKTVFKAIAIRAGLDILPAPKIQGKVTLNITSKSWQQALEIICNLYQLAWLIEDEYVFVLTKDEYQKRLEKDASNELQYDLIAPKMQKIYHIKHADVNELQSVINGIRSSQGKVTVFPRNNAVVVYDNAIRQAKIDSTIAILDVATRQVLISAKLVVVTNTFEQRLGVEWYGNSGIGATAADPTIQSAANTGMIDSRTTMSVSNSEVGGNLKFGMLNGTAGVNVQQFLADNNYELLAQPQISTLDHKEAEIFMGSERTIRVLDANGVVAQRQTDAGIRLKVTPHVIGNDRIRMELAPENKSFANAPDGGLQIESQEAKTELVVRNGQTAVIAGLTKNEEAEVEKGIPFLKDIPLLGYLFKTTETKVEKKDLIIFITPNILDIDEDQKYISEKLIQEPIDEATPPEALETSKP